MPIATNKPIPEKGPVMPRSPLGKTLVIANPAAHSGAGEKGARFAEDFLQSYSSATNGFEVVRTTAPEDAIEMAASASGYDTVLALGGDGIIHEVVNGLMGIQREARPQLGIIPMGSGNDYARTLGMRRNDVQGALAQLVRGIARPCDLGLVNGVHFMETLSFGLDAAIANDTTIKRAEGTTQVGEELFIRSAIKILSEAKEGFKVSVSFDEDDPVDLCSIIFAIQVGPTYGGGFKICPEADPSDGYLDTCYNVKLPKLPKLMTLLGLARVGRHTLSKVVHTRRLRHAELHFEVEPPCQVDGEMLRGNDFIVDVVPAAIDVIFPRFQ